MTPEEETHDHPVSEEDPEPVTLLKDRRATIQFDGLIMGAFNQAKRLYQAGVHVNAEHHHLVITLKRNGKDITAEKLPDWDGSHETIKKLAPFWLYVDSGNGMNPKTYNAKLNNPDDPDDPKSFGKIFSFVRKHGHELKMNPSRFAVFNFAQGTAYSALNTTAKLGRIEPGEPGEPPTVTPLGDINVSTLSAIDIADVSDRQTKRELVFAGANGKHVFFRLPLDEGTLYEIKMKNQPIHPNGTDPAEHFLQYYELFELNGGEKKFVVQLRPHRRPRGADDSAESDESPPCVGTSGGETGGLGGG